MKRDPEAEAFGREQRRRDVWATIQGADRRQAAINDAIEADRARRVVGAQLREAGVRLHAAICYAITLQVSQAEIARAIGGGWDRKNIHAFLRRIYWEQELSFWDPQDVQAFLARSREEIPLIPEVASDEDAPF